MGPNLHGSSDAVVAQTGMCKKRVLVPCLVPQISSSGWSFNSLFWFGYISYMGLIISLDKHHPSLLYAGGSNQHMKALHSKLLSWTIMKQIIHTMDRHKQKHDAVTEKKTTRRGRRRTQILGFNGSHGKNEDKDWGEEGRAGGKMLFLVMKAAVSPSWIHTHKQM